MLHRVTSRQSLSLVYRFSSYCCYSNRLAIIDQFQQYRFEAYSEREKHLESQQALSYLSPLTAAHCRYWYANR